MKPLTAWGAQPRPSSERHLPVRRLTWLTVAKQGPEGAARVGPSPRSRLPRSPPVRAATARAPAPALTRAQRSLAVARWAPASPPLSRRAPPAQAHPGANPADAASPGAVPAAAGPRRPSGGGSLAPAEPAPTRRLCSERQPPPALPSERRRGPGARPATLMADAPRSAPVPPPRELPPLPLGARAPAGNGDRGTAR